MNIDRISTVYGRGAECLGADWEAIIGSISKGVDTVVTVAGAARQLLGPTQKALTGQITGSQVGGVPVQPYSAAPKSSFPVISVIIGVGVLGIVALFMLRR